MNISLLIGIYFIIFIGLLLLITTIVFLIGFAISVITIVFSIMLSIILLWIATKYYFPEKALNSFLLLFIIISLLFLTCGIIGSIFYDISYDGQWYHQVAIIDLIGGWNPIYQTKIDQVSMNNRQELATTQISRFPKGSWICAAALFKLTNNLESGKTINLLLISASFFLSLAACLTFGARRLLLKSLIISSLVAFNPVAIYQSLSFYVDGQMASTISCIFPLLLLLYRRPRWPIFLALIMCIIILINVKFTGLVYAVVLGVGFSALFIFFGEKVVARKIVAAFSLGVLLGVFFVGYNPYIVNTLAYANPFYPVLSKEHNMDMYCNSPADFHELNRVSRLVRSVFGASDNARGSFTSKFKMPFSLSINEARAFINTDTRVGGFGPFFGGIFLIALGVFPLSLFYRISGSKEAIAIALVILLSTLAIAEAWWARYAPQLWLIPIISIILLLYNDRYFINRIVGWSLVAILFINILLISGVYFRYNTYATIRLTRALTSLANNPHPVHVYFYFPSARVKFQRMGIKFQEVDSLEKLDCSNPIKIPHIGAKVCLE